MLWCLASLTIGASMLLVIPALYRRIGAENVVRLAGGVPLAMWFSSVLDVARIDPNRCRGLRVGEFVGFVLGQYALAFATVILISGIAVDTMTEIDSMYEGDRIVVERSAYSHREPRHGDMVVFTANNYQRTRRLLGLPGDEVRLLDGQVFINGWAVPRCIIGDVDGSYRRKLALEFLEGHAYLTGFDGWDTEPSWWHGIRVVPHPDRYLVAYDLRGADGWWETIGRFVPFSEDFHLEGAALFVWQGGEPGRVGASATDPRLPSKWGHHRREFERCMATRPPLEQTIPPPPRESDHAGLERVDAPSVTFYSEPPATPDGGSPK